MNGRLEPGPVVRWLLIVVTLATVVSFADACSVKKQNAVKNSVVSKKEATAKNLTIDQAFDLLKKRLDIRVLKPQYLPKGFFVSPTYDVHENYGQNPRIVRAERAEIELEKAGSDPYSEHGHKWIRISFGTKIDIGTLTTEGAFVNGNPALVIGGDQLSWNLVSWTDHWRGKEIRYAVEGAGISNKELLKIARSMKPF